MFKLSTKREDRGRSNLIQRYVFTATDGVNEICCLISREDLKHALNCENNDLEEAIEDNWARIEEAARQAYLSNGAKSDDVEFNLT